MKELINKFIHDKSDEMMLIRTMAEVIFGWVESNLIVLVGLVPASAEVKALLISLFTVVNTAIINWYRKSTEKENNSEDN